MSTLTPKTHEQYFVGVLKKYEADEGETKYYNALCWYPKRTGGARYVTTLDEAKAVLDNAYKLWNRTHTYNSKGERYETSEAAPGIGVSLVCTPETDERHRIVKHIIKKRIVTEWEIVEEE